MISRTSSTMIVLLASVGSSSALCAQGVKAPTLDEILKRLSANLERYDAGVPSFFCDEHAVSQVVPGLPRENTTTDSVFRLKRTPNPDHTSTLVESREIKTVDGKPPAKRDLDGPTLLNGAFEGGLAVVSLDQATCTNYTLQRINRNRPAEPYVIRFETILTPQNTANCLLQEDSKGRATIDPASMQITHLEFTTPHHVIRAGRWYAAPVAGKRVVTVDYAPVLLGGVSFWMPSTISLKVTSGAGTFHAMVWSFQATYRNYHKEEVTSRILPDGAVPAP